MNPSLVLCGSCWAFACVVNLQPLLDTLSQGGLLKRHLFKLRSQCASVWIKKHASPRTGSPADHGSLVAVSVIIAALT